MIEILIAENSIYYTRDLINNINKKNTYTRLCAIATNDEEIIEGLQQNKVDIILLDLEVLELGGFKLLNKLSRQYSDNYKKSVIVISNDNNNFKIIRNNPCVYSCVNKIKGIDNTLNEIQKLVEIKQKEKIKNTFEENVIHEISKLNYNLSYKGTKYLIESVMLIWNKKDIENINLKRDIFPVIAKKYNKTVNNIKININNATEIIFYDCPQYKLNDYFGYKITNKPKVKLVICTILQKLYGSIKK